LKSRLKNKKDRWRSGTHASDLGGKGNGDDYASHC